MDPSISFRYHGANMPDLDKALVHFKRVDPILYKAAKMHAHTIPAHKRKTRDQLFASLCESVVSQQLSVKAADTIWKRLEEACGGTVSPASIKKISLARMRKCGLSAAKSKTLKELAKAVNGGLDLPSLRKASPEEAVESLTKVWGIGPWTSEMFLMFGLGHPDIFSPGDLGLVRSMETLYGLKKDGSKTTLVKIAECWSPHRSLACRVLWRSRDSA